jgi:hypothetical protein
MANQSAFQLESGESERDKGERVLRPGCGLCCSLLLLLSHQPTRARAPKAASLSLLSPAVAVDVEVDGGVEDATRVTAFIVDEAPEPGAWRNEAERESMEAWR